MNPEDAAYIQRAERAAQARRDHELELFNTTAGSRAKLSHPMYGGRSASSARSSATTSGLVKTLPAPSGLTTWGTRGPPAIEHVGGGYHLVAINLVSEDAGWLNSGGFHARWSIAVWLIRPDASISAAQVTPGYIQTGYTSGEFELFDFTAPPYGEPVDQSTMKLTRWQEGALLSFTILTDERQYIAALSDFWPQSGTLLDVPWGANVYRHIGHDGTDPIIGPALELYVGKDADFDLKGDYESGELTFHDDGTIEGFEVIGPSADTNICVFGISYEINRQRAWLLSKNSSNVITLVERTTLHSPSVGNPGGLTRIAADRWISMTSASSGMSASLFNAKTGTVIDTLAFNVDGGSSVDCYFIVTPDAYYAGNHLHFDGQATFAGWLGPTGSDDVAHRYTTLTAVGDVLAAGDIEQWAVETRASRGSSNAWGYSVRYVETCDGCLRLIDGWTMRQQALFERREYKAGLELLVTPEFDFEYAFNRDMRVVPSSHPAGYMWSAVSSTYSEAFDGAMQVQPVLIRHPA